MSWFLTKVERQSLARVIKMLDIKKTGFALSLLLGVAGLGAAVGLSATAAWLIARASQQPPVLYLTVAATAVRMFGVMRALFRYLQRLASHKVALEGMDSLRISIYDTLIAGPIERISQLQRGDLLNRTGADVDTVGDLVVKSILPTCVTLIVGLGTVIGFAFLSIPAALVLLISMLISGLLVPVLTMRSTRLAEIAEADSKRDLSVTTVTIIEGADELQIDGRYPSMLDRLNRISSTLNKARAAAARPAALAAAVDRVAMGVAVIGSLIVATPAANSGVLAAVAMAVLVLTPLAAFEGTSELAPAAAQLVRSAQAAVRITDMLGPNGSKRRPHALPQTTGPVLKATELSIGWPGGPLIAQGFNLELRPGSRIAVVGPSGIGKTTLLYTLAGMLEPRSGKVDLFDCPIWNADREAVTSHISLTTEDAHIFATTVYENLRVANAELSKATAEELLVRMGLGTWLSGLPHGLDTQLGSGGTSISGGERRRLLLARALACPAPLMLLDEPGEHLDAETADQLLFELLRGTDSDRGVLLVTHRLSALISAEQILVVDRSGDSTTVISSGTHAELLEKSDYYRWAVSQEK